MSDKTLRVNGDVQRRLQIGIVLGLTGLLGLAYWLVGPFQTEVDRAIAILSSGDLEQLKAYIQSFGNWAPIVSLVLMVVQALVAPVPSFAITFANGLVYGVYWGWLLSVAGHALAATVCFWIARSLGRQLVEVMTGRAGLTSIDDWIKRRGALAVLVARLVPGISFDVVSYAVGLTGMGYGRFILATIAGTMPQTLLYAFLGQNAPQYGWMMFLASGLTITSVITVSLLRWRRSRTTSPAPTPRRASLGRSRPHPVAIEPMSGGD